MTEVVLFLLALVCGVILLFACYMAQDGFAGREKERPSLALEVLFSILFSLAAFWLYCHLMFSWSSEGWPLNYRRLFQASWPGGLSLVYLLCSAGIRRLGRKLFSYPVLQPYFALNFYVESKDEEGQVHWYLRRPKKGLITIFLWTSRFLLFVTMLVSLALWFSTSAGSAIDYLVPVCALLPVHSVLNYLNGKTEPVYLEDEDEKKRESNRTKTYAYAAEALEDAYGDALLFKQLPIERKSELKHKHVLESLERSKSLSNQMVSAYFQSVYQDEDFDPDYIMAAAHLLDHENTMIYNPFYRDLGRYLAMPFNDALNARRKILILAKGNEEVSRIIEWMRETLDEHARFAEKWKIRALSSLIPDCDVGVLSYSKLYEPSVLLKNRRFFEQTEYVLLLEPSSVLCDIQAGLGVLSSLLFKGHKPVYCVIDRSLNGLKDTLSHVLKTGFDFECGIGESAKRQTLMIWDGLADYHSIERFGLDTNWFGGGVEIGAVAVGAGVDKIKWRSEKSMPLYDVQNLAASSYESICETMRIAPSQSELKKHLQVEPSFFDDRQQNSGFLILEDEYHNPFAQLRDFRSRAGEDLFLHVLCEDYLLRDYFCANAQMFVTNPHSIRSLVSAYAKTPRNLMISLLLKMNIEPMRLQELGEQMSLGGVETDDPIGMLKRMLGVYTDAKDDLLVIKTRRISRMGDRPIVETMVSIDPERFDAYFGRTLKNVSYVLEDEQRNRHFLKARLYSLIPQTLLPDQHMTFEGRNYTVREISASNGVILSRASDQSIGRRRVRQYREYCFETFDCSKPMSSRQISGIDFLVHEVNFSVKTDSFEECITHSGLDQIKLHRFTSEADIEELSRSYRNKTILRVRMEKMPQEDLVLLASLLQDLLETVLPEGVPYLAFLAQTQEIQNANLYYTSTAVPKGEIWVVEDSEMDLGLLESVYTYFFTFLDILQDYLKWKTQKDAADKTKTKGGSSRKDISRFEYEGVLEDELEAIKDPDFESDEESERSDPAEDRQSAQDLEDGENAEAEKENPAENEEDINSTDGKGGETDGGI